LLKDKKTKITVYVKSRQVTACKCLRCEQCSLDSFQLHFLCIRWSSLSSFQGNLLASATFYIRYSKQRSAAFTWRHSSSFTLLHSQGIWSTVSSGWE